MRIQGPLAKSSKGGLHAKGKDFLAWNRTHNLPFSGPGGPPLGHRELAVVENVYLLVRVGLVSGRLPKTRE